MSDLRNGWVETTLGEIIQLRGEKCAPASVPDVSFIGLEGIEPHTSKLLHIGKASEVKSSVAVFKENDVLYSRLRPYLNKVAVAPFDGVASAEILALVPNESTTVDFVRWRIMTQEFLDFAALLDKGDRPRVNYKEISTFPLALPPLAEQKRIVVKIDRLTTHTASARVELEHIPALVDKYKARLLSLAFSGGLWAVSPDGLKQKPPQKKLLKDLVESLRYGTAQKGYEKPIGVPVLRIPNVVSGRIDIQNLKYSELDDKEFSKLKLRAGDILVVRSNGSTSLVGRPAVVSGEAIGMAYAGYLIRLRPLADQVVPEFLALMLQAPEVRANIESCTRSTSGVHNVNAKELGVLEIPFFALEDQKEIVCCIKTAFAWLDRVSADHDAAIKLLPKLNAAILSKAFRGDLVDQDLNDESTSTILSRVRAARVVSPKKPSLRRKKVDPMIKDPKEHLLQDSESWPDNGLPFEEVARRNSMPHDDIRDAIFALLEEEKPRLKQAFDKNAECMHLQRVKA